MRSAYRSMGPKRRQQTTTAPTCNTLHSGRLAEKMIAEEVPVSRLLLQGSSFLSLRVSFRVLQPRSKNMKLCVPFRPTCSHLLGTQGKMNIPHT